MNRLVLLLLLAGCHQPPAPAPPPDPRIVLRDEARLVLERHCGQCHIRSQPTAIEAALKVYDLEEPEWSARMTAAQLREAAGRLADPLAPDGRANDATDAERATLRRYVDSVIATR